MDSTVDGGSYLGGPTAEAYLPPASSGADDTKGAVSIPTIAAPDASTKDLSEDPDYWKHLHHKSQQELLMRVTQVGIEHKSVALITSRILLYIIIVIIVFAILYVYVQTLNTRAMFGRFYRWFNDPSLALANVGMYAPIISNHRDDPKTFQKTGGKTKLPVYTATFDMLTTNVWYPSNAKAQTLFAPGFYIGPQKARFLLWMLQNFAGSMNRLSWIGNPNVDVSAFVSAEIANGIKDWGNNKPDAIEAFKHAWCCWNNPENYMRFLFPTPQAYLQSMHLYNVAVGMRAENTDLGKLLRKGICGWLDDQDPLDSLGTLIGRIFINIGGTPPKMDCTAQKAMADLEGAMTGTMIASTAMTTGIGIALATGAETAGIGVAVGVVVAVVGAAVGAFVGWLTGKSGEKKAQDECDQTDINNERKSAVNWCINQGLGAYLPNWNTDWAQGTNLSQINQDYCQANGDTLAIYTLAFNSVCANNPICIV